MGGGGDTIGGGAWGPAEPRTENIYGCPVPNGIRFEMTHYDKILKEL